MKGRVLRCPKCGAGEGDIHFACHANVPLEMEAIEDDGSFAVNYGELYRLRQFYIECMKCGLSAVRYHQHSESTKALMREWSEEVED